MAANTSRPPDYRPPPGPPPPPSLQQQPSSNIKYASPPPREVKPNQFPKLNNVVTVEHCHYYLSLMEQFLLYKEKFDPFHLKILLARAERRYIQWRHIIQSSFSRSGYKPFVPPLDVAYLWHAHMLSPFRYFEDAIRLNQTSIFKMNLPLRQLYQNATSYLDPTVMNTWALYYGNDEPYMLTPENVVVGTTTVDCSFCSSSMQCSWIEYADWRHDPFMGIHCHTCRSSTTVGTTSVVRLNEDIESRSFLIAGTLLEKNGNIKQPGRFQIQRTMAHVMKIAEEKLLPEFRLLVPQRSMDQIIGFIQDMADPNKNTFYGKGSSMQKTQDWHRTATPLLVNALRGCYQNNPSPFSLDLIQAVGRQQDFNIKAVIKIDWQSPFGIVRGIRQYNEFLKMIMMYPSQVMVPTLEIDLAWHTHMLHPAAYRIFTFKYTGQYVNHDDNIVPERLKQFADGTDKVWRETNGHNLINKNVRELNEKIHNGNDKKSKRGSTFFGKIRKTFNPGLSSVDYNPGTLMDATDKFVVESTRILSRRTKSS
ncbi:hypothetical protein BDA99DRAFT_209677 [Phascolomyces articulosus]|uniref:Uncharacterized protein n=1 Tax=Phascolomyces articulosus TaxID=60185 RepID=A0AAD5K4J3_9FUNG|nr:hypothetical protein BDA99DRAFT_209677 [Phascolomyces articulosus]